MQAALAVALLATVLPSGTQPATALRYARWSLPRTQMSSSADGPPRADLSSALLKTTASTAAGAVCGSVAHEVARSLVLPAHTLIDTVINVAVSRWHSNSRSGVTCTLTVRLLCILPLGHWLRHCRWRDSWATLGHGIGVGEEWGDHDHAAGRDRNGQPRGG
jgi:hypothetical protein